MEYWSIGKNDSDHIRMSPIKGGRSTGLNPMQNSSTPSLRHHAVRYAG